MKKKLSLLFAFLALFLVGCAGSEIDDVFRFETHQLELTVGDEATVTLIYGSVGRNEEIVYEVENDEYISFVDGKITAKKAGSTRITATVVENPTTKAVLNVTVNDTVLSALKINGESTLLIDEVAKYTVETNPSGISNEVTWRSSNQSIATVDATGNVRAISAGTVTISATSRYDTTIVAQKQLEVKYHDATDITVSFEEGSSSIEVGATAKLTATVSPALANSNCTYTSSDETVATVENGVITAVKVGEAVITVASFDGLVTREVAISVVYAAATGIEVLENEGDYYVSDSFTIEATVSPENADPNIVITSSASDMVEIDDNVITFLKAGEVVITVKSNDSKVEKTLTFNVLPIPEVTSITVSIEDGATQLEQGLSAEIEVNVLPEKAVQDYEITSSNESVATVTLRGLRYNLRAVGVGTTTITVTSVANPTVTASITITVVPLE